MSEFYVGKNVLVTGGASFIASHLVDALVTRGAKVRVVDNLSSGKIANIVHHLDRRRIQLVHGDLLHTEVAEAAVKDEEIVFHLACNHGGRGYVDIKQAECATNFALDGIVIQAAQRAGAKVVFASSGCVYPLHLQKDPANPIPLMEDMVGPPYDADNSYGYAKLVAEMTLRAFRRQFGMKAAIGRFFTVYGERGYESHAITALIARAFVRQNPYVVWGTGEQVRNWTHVSDIVAGLLLLGEHVDDAEAYNLGTTEGIRVIDAVQEILRYTGREDLLVETKPAMPSGPAVRVANHDKATQILGWAPQVRFVDGLHRMVDWYFMTKDPTEVREILAAQ